MSSISFVIDELESLLEAGNAHASFESAIKGLPPPLLGKVPDGSAYSVWQLVEHIRIAQWDILEFSGVRGIKALNGLMNTGRKIPSRRMAMH